MVKPKDEHMLNFKIYDGSEVETTPPETRLYTVGTFVRFLEDAAGQLKTVTTIPVHFC